MYIPVILQADDPESMMSWISAIQANNNPDEDVSVLCIVFHGVQDSEIPEIFFETNINAVFDWFTVMDQKLIFKLLHCTCFQFLHVYQR